MGCNYYAHILPSTEQKQELFDAINNNDFPLVNKLTEEMYGPLKMSYEDNQLIGGVVHLGKRSCGWKFLWNPNLFIVRHGHLEDYKGQRRYVEDPNTVESVYPLTKEGIKSFIDKADVVIYDEYDELQDKEEFWKKALEWGNERDDGGWDAASYEEYEATEHPHFHQYTVTGELTDHLRSHGYKFTSASNSDFYSDGLRFAGYNEFS